ncbi:MAG: hypothetical protein IT289_12685 [Oligoflexia bacterium]|nr:hypothetical protein [Oligoflexia bacterium]
MKTLLSIIAAVLVTTGAYGQEGEPAPIQPAPEIQAPPVEVSNPIPTPAIEPDSTPAKTTKKIKPAKTQGKKTLKKSSKPERSSDKKKLKKQKPQKTKKKGSLKK